MAATLYKEYVSSEKDYGYDPYMLQMLQAIHGKISEIDNAASQKPSVSPQINNDMRKIYSERFTKGAFQGGELHDYKQNKTQ
jgi:hypothetical protein